MGSLNLNEEGDVDYKQLGMTPFWVMRKQDRKAKPMLEQEDLNTYIDYYLMQVTTDWYMPDNGSRFQFERFEARPCS